MTEIRSITIVGAGQMGAGIAQVAAVAGYDVSLVDVAPGQLERATVTMQTSSKVALLTPPKPWRLAASSRTG